jgi:hypothetical protein
VRRELLERGELPAAVHADLTVIARDIYIDAIRMQGDHDKALLSVYLSGVVQGGLVILQKQE